MPDADVLVTNTHALKDILLDGRAVVAENRVHQRFANLGRFGGVS
jgi:hypothetical protein